MTEERKTPDLDGIEDARVSGAYRDLATERAPARLDTAVLNEAARAAHSGYSRLRLWTRPAAWAAIVLLSAALLLEVSQPPSGLEQALPAPEEADAARARRESATLLQEGRQNKLVDEAAEMARTQQSLDDEPMPQAGEQPAAAAFKADRMLPSSAPALGSAERLEKTAPACEESQRADPESWLACIEELEQAGRDEAAREERRLFDEAYPDFEAP